MIMKNPISIIRILLKNIWFIVQSLPDENRRQNFHYALNFMFSENHVADVVENKAAYSEYKIRPFFFFS